LRLHFRGVALPLGRVERRTKLIAQSLQARVLGQGGIFLRLRRAGEGRL